MTMYRPHRLRPKENKSKETGLYRSLCISIVSMFLSTVLLVGTTFAWFSSSLQTGVYTITSANFSTTVYYCTELSSGKNVPNNWQRLNPSNTTLFGGGTLSSDGQVAYLKLVSNSNIPLQYTFELITDIGNSNESTGTSITGLSLTGCQYKSNTEDESAPTPLEESDLATAVPTTGSTSQQSVTFDVPKMTEDNSPVTVFAVLKLTYSSSGETETQTTYNFSLKLGINQVNGGETESNNTVLTTNLYTNYNSNETSGDPASTLPTAVNSDESTPSNEGVIKDNSDENEEEEEKTVTADGSRGDNDAGSSGELTGSANADSDAGTSGTSDPAGTESLS